ncbi:SCP-like extracellular protein [Chitinophaga caeni]|uniref:SCP-like extracellular protein n=1 Tax=Chitinophaga caeni TaxID=2029983 RepID=A0A291QRS8_9BACT|nr:CAP domain-containing protein [Chitinophaga caeni]ATL46592.1 SCP-like extracellular protein [Chitinophaga caeni]
MFRFLSLAVIVVCIILFASCEKIDLIPAPITHPQPVTQDTSSAPPTAVIINNNINADTLLLLVNEVRAKGCHCGDTYMPPVAPLSWNNLLEFAAVSHSKDMYTKNYFDHIGKDGKNPGQRLDAVGYDWRYYGENIAKGPGTEAVVIAGWLNSPGHCKNIMNANFTEMGVGKYGSYWTQTFGQPFSSN